MTPALFQFRVRSLLILTLIVALNLCCWRTGSDGVAYASFMIGSAFGIKKARLRYWQTILFAGIGGAIGLVINSPGGLLYVFQQEPAINFYSISELAWLFLLGTIALTFVGFLTGVALGLLFCPFLFLLHRYVNVIDRFRG